MAESALSAISPPVDSWCVTRLNTVETKYHWMIENFNNIKKPLDNLKSSIFSSAVGENKTMHWQLMLTLRADNKENSSIKLCRLDKLTDEKPIVKVTLMIINKDQQVEHTVNIISEIASDKELEIPGFIKSNSSILKEKQNLSILCYLKIGLNSVKVFSSDDHLVEANAADCPAQVIKDLQKLNGDVILSDCILTCENKKFYVQKAILAGRSTTFFNMFKNHQDNKQENAKAVDPLSKYEVYDIQLKHEVLTELLNFIYTGQLQNIQESTVDLLSAAETFALAGMKTLCATHLGQKLSIDNAIDMLLLSVKYDTVHLKEQVIDFMMIHAKSIVNSPSFKTIGSLPDKVREDIIRLLLQKK